MENNFQEQVKEFNKIMDDVYCLQLEKEDHYQKMIEKANEHFNNGVNLDMILYYDFETHYHNAVKVMLDENIIERVSNLINIFFEQWKKDNNIG